jgi:hypothetical protein
MGLAMIEKCDELWQCGYLISRGMKREIDYAVKLGIPVVDKLDLLVEQWEQELEGSDYQCLSTPLI